MEHSSHINRIRIFPVAIGLLCIALAGCSTTRRAAGTALGGGVGAAATYGLISTSPAGVATGAVVGAIAGGMGSGAAKAEQQELFDEGYIRGNSDAVKKHYWMRQRMEASQQSQAQVYYYELPGATETEDGRKLVPHTVTIPIIE